MATYRRGTNYSMLTFARITDSVTLAAFQSSPTLTPASITEIKNKLLWSDECQNSIVLISGDAFKMYLPLTADNFDVDIDGFQIDILGADFSTVDDNVGTVQSGTYPGGTYYYIEFTVPAIVQADCVLAIVDPLNSDRLYYLSSYVNFVSASENVDYPFFKVRSTRNGYLHFWEEILSDIPTFYNQFRLDVNKVDSKYEYQIEQEKESLTGEIIDVIDDVDHYIVLETYLFTEEMHRGFAILVWCDTILINDQQYVKKSGYDPNSPTLNGQTMGRVELYDLDFATANKEMSV